MRTSLLALLFVSLPALAAVDAKSIYEHKCQGCHGADGAGHTRMGEKNKLPDFSSTRWQQGTSNEELIDVITNGSKHNQKMKAYKGKLSTEEIKAVAEYLRSLGTNLK